MSDTGNNLAEVHLVVLSHGLWGNPAHLKYLASQLEKKHGDSLHILNAKCNTDSYTYDGIDICGERLTDEIRDEIRSLRESRRITKFSIIGYSLGGLMARYAIGVLHREGIFSEIKPWMFTSFATPHLGIRREDKRMLIQTFNWVSRWLLSKTGEQLQLIDNYEDSRPILAVLADPDGVFYKALLQFQHRILYANTKNDRSVPFWTAAILEVDPFGNLEDLVLGKDEKFSTIVQSLAKKDKGEGTDKVASLKRLSNFARNLPRYVLVALVAPIFVPLWMIFVFSILSVQGALSRRRVKKIMVSKGKRGGDGKQSSQFIVAATAMEEEGIEAVVNIRNFFPPAPPPPMTENSVKSSFATKMDQFCSASLFPRLSLTDFQREAITNLNRLGFEKIAVAIDSFNAHAAIVVRNKRFNPGEGKIVVKHYIEEVFIA